jgi:polyisoprenoid-binding protein YceI
MENMQTKPGLPAALPQLGGYSIDTSRSLVRFRTRHLFGLLPVRGTLAIRSGSVDIAEPLTESAIRVDIDAASFRTMNPQRNASVRSARLLDSARFPVITFDNGRASADDRAVTGELTVRDVTRPVTLAIRAVALSGDEFTATAAVRIDRTEFGITALRGLAARYLDLSVEVSCVRK